LLREGQQVQAPLVDLRDEELGVLVHLVGVLEERRDLLERVGPGRRVREVDLRLRATLSDGGERTLDRALHEVRDSVAARTKGARAEHVRHDRATQTAHHGAVERRQEVAHRRRDRVRVGVGLRGRRPLRSRDRGTGDGLDPLQPRLADRLHEVLTERPGGLVFVLVGALAGGHQPGDTRHQGVGLLRRLDLLLEFVGLGQVAVDLRLLLVGERPTLGLDPLGDLTGGLEGGLTLLLEVHPQSLSAMEMTARTASTDDPEAGSSDLAREGSSSLAGCVSLAFGSWSASAAAITAPMASCAARRESMCFWASTRPALTPSASASACAFTARISVSWFAPIGTTDTSYSASSRSSLTFCPSTSTWPSSSTS